MRGKRETVRGKRETVRGKREIVRGREGDRARGIGRQIKEDRETQRGETMRWGRDNKGE